MVTSADPSSRPSRPTLVVLIPVHQNQTGLNKSLHNLRTTQGEFDVIVVDDGSMPAVAAPEALRPNTHVTVLRLPQNRGITDALNHGVDFAIRAGYSYIARLDSADTVVPHRFVAQLALLESNPCCALVSSFVDFVDADGNFIFRHTTPVNHTQIVRELRVRNCLLHTSVMIRVSAIRAVGFYDRDFLLAEDYELFVRLSRSFQVAAVPESLTFTVYDENGLSLRHRRDQILSRLRVQTRYIKGHRGHVIWGVVRTLIALVLPQRIVIRWKRAWAQS